MGSPRLATILALLTLLLSTAALAAENVGEIKKFEGSVFVRRQGAMRREAVEKADTPLAVGDVIETGAKSRAFVKFADGNKAVVEETSLLSITGAGEVSQEAGSIYFEVKKRKDVIGLQVRSKVAVIGVKGTRFLVSLANARLYVCVERGVVDISSVRDKFRRFRQKKEYAEKSGDMEELNRRFEKDLDDMNRTFESGVEVLEAEYERLVKRMDQEFAAEVDKFDLDEGGGAVIDGVDARDYTPPPSIKRGFSALDLF